MIKSKYPLFRKLKASQTMTVSIFWSECATQAIACFCSMIGMLILLSVIIGDDMEKIKRFAEYGTIALIVLWSIPVVRNTRYRLQDAGYGMKTYLWLLLPIIGWIVFFIRLCAKSLPRKGDGTLF